ncbi:hypothetical protein SAMN05421753_11149 [Planctomicrobium piriforme]|uniref:Uncharacterized protein n=1 Tax=Planctomicrobium piriforme TaxID=1576369 RepID=A0A1I3JXU7_9PLAN|nr:hypothetical protein SAMN05421753_11149 [Planctomicrobium piriforme]
MNHKYAKSSHVFLVALVMAVMNVEIIQGDDGACCNNENNSDCSGCHKIGKNPLDPNGSLYIHFGNNTVYRCQTYGAPITCLEKNVVCFYATGQYNIFSDPACTVVFGVGDAGDTIYTNGCDLDYCD